MEATTDFIRSEERFQVKERCCLQRKQKWELRALKCHGCVGVSVCEGAARLSNSAMRSWYMPEMQETVIIHEAAARLGDTDLCDK